MPNKGRTVVLIACSSRKLDRSTRARDLYQGTLFRASLDWAQSKKPDEICILSAQYGLVGLDQVIEPYDLTLNTLPIDQVRAWSDRVFGQLASQFDPDSDRFILLAGEKYRRFLAPRLANVEVPLACMRIGEQVSWLQGKAGRRRSDGEAPGSCQAVHDLANSLPRHSFPLDASRIPANGLYILFERGERAHRGDRIVRIGTHTGDGNLRKRLREHFETEKKDRSIFRKNIGRAMLAAEGNPLLEEWNRDLTSRAARERFGDQVDQAALGKVEARVSEYMRDRFSFVVLEVSDRDDRLRLEQSLIGTVAHCPHCEPSREWLGNDSPVDAIKNSGLWQTQHLSAEPMSAAEVVHLAKGDAIPPKESAAAPKSTSAKRVPGHGKYSPLREYLASAPDTVTLSFAELEGILGDSLPASARSDRPWWANHKGANKSSQSQAWQDAGFRVDAVKLGPAGSVRVVRTDAGKAGSKTPRPPDAVIHEQASTHGGRTRRFQWLLDGDTLQIESESGVSHAFTIRETLAVLQLLHAHFRNNWIALANNVEKLHHGTERYGLGGAIHQQRPGDTHHAQGASYLGVVLEHAGILEWNGKSREIQWRIRRMPAGTGELRTLLTRASGPSSRSPEE